MKQPQWRKGSKPKILLDYLCSTRVINGDGSQGIKDWFGLEDAIDLICANLDGHDDEFLRAAIVEAVANSKQELEAAEFIRIYQAKSAELRRATRDYFVVVSLWGRVNYFLGKQPELAGLSLRAIDPENDVAKEITSQQDRIVRNGAAFSRRYWDHDTYAPFLASVNAMSDKHAFGVINRKLCTVLGLINLVDGFESRPFPGSVGRKAIGHLLVAPFSTVHFSNGSLASSDVWTTAWESGHQIPAQPDGAMVNRVMHSVERHWREIENSPWRNDCLTALLLFYDFVSQPDSDAALVTAWRLLEITGGGQEAKQEVLIKRAVAFYRDRDLALAKAAMFRANRNAVAHGSRWPSPTGRTAVSQMRRFIAPLVGNFLINPYGFPTKEVFWEFCDSLGDDRRRESAMRITWAHGQMQRWSTLNPVREDG